MLAERPTSMTAGRPCVDRREVGVCNAILRAYSAIEARVHGPRMQRRAPSSVQKEGPRLIRIRINPKLIRIIRIYPNLVSRIKRR